MGLNSTQKGHPMTDVVIASGSRTPVGSFTGSFANVPAHDLGTVAIKAALERAKVAPVGRVRSHLRPDPRPLGRDRIPGARRR